MQDGWTVPLGGVRLGRLRGGRLRVGPRWEAGGKAESSEELNVDS